MIHFFGSGCHLSENSYKCYEIANVEIAKWAEYYLGKHLDFHQSSWIEGKVTNNPDDILLGNPTWDSRNANTKKVLGKFLRNWVKDNALKVDAPCHPNTYILMPWVPEFPQLWIDSMPYLQSQLLAGQKIFALCGEIWIEQTLAKADDSIQSQLSHKLVHCNMGVAAESFPIHKQKI